MVDKSKSDRTLFAQAQRVIPGGVNSPVRAFQSVDGVPVFIRRGEGAYIFGENGERYIDYVNSWGPMILGHADPRVVEAVARAIPRGLSFGAPTELETEMAEYLCARLPWLEQVRMVNSGTEAAMSAIRLARGVTGRDKIVKFEGCYHGHADCLLVKAGSGALTLGVPDSQGVPANMVADTLTATFNDLDSLRQIFAQTGTQIAAVIVEPVAGNMNCIPPQPGFLRGLRDICDEFGSLLLMDEVMTGFRVGSQGAQGLYEVRGDITILGKIIGGGLPVGAFGASAEIMAHLAPQGGVYQAGTLSGNPIAMAAGLATLRATESTEFYPALDARAHALCAGLRDAAVAAGVALRTNQVGAMFGIFFTEAEEVTTYAQATASSRDSFAKFFHAMRAQGVYFAPSAFEAGFVCAAHDAASLDATLTAAKTVFANW